MQRILMVLTILFCLGGIYFGYTFIVSKTLGSAPKVDSKSPEDTAEEEKERKEKEQRQKVQEMKQQQRQLMEERQRTLRYHRSR